MNIEDKLHLINKLKAEVDNIMPQKAWDEAFLEKIKIELTYNSNKIESNTITYSQTVKLLEDFVTPQNASNLILLKRGYPPIFIREIDRTEYLQRFEEDEQHPQAMLDFLADRLIESLQIKLYFIKSTVE